MLELHFCSQCGISIPLTEVESGAAKSGAPGDVRLLCREHRTAQGASGGNGVGGTAPGGTAPGGTSASLGSMSPGAMSSAGGGDFQLLFCANCNVSVPADDERSGRATREYGSLLCAGCAPASPADRDRRRKSVEQELADELPRLAAASPTAAVAGAPLSSPASREISMSAAGLAQAPRPASSGSWVLVTFVVVLSGAATFFATEWFQARRAAAATSAAASGGRTDAAELRRVVDGTIRDLMADFDQRELRVQAEHEKAFDELRARFQDDFSALRKDLADVRTELMAAGAATTDRVTRLEGRVDTMSDMVRGLAARPQDGGGRGNEPPRENGGGGNGANGGGNGGGNGGPSANAEDGPLPGQPTPPAPPDPAITKLVKDLLESKEDGVRFAAALELIRQKSKFAAAPLAKVAVEDENVMVRRVAAGGLGDLLVWNAIPVLIQVLEDREPYVAQRANFALQQLTGQDFGVTQNSPPRDRKTRAGAATKWWEKNKDKPIDGACMEPVAIAAPSR